MNQVDPNTSKQMGYGVFGGVFDPVHCGHLIAARTAIEQLPVDRIIFLPAGFPPHKKPPRATAEDRIEMLRRALESEPRFTLDRREIDREGPSYTVETLRDLRDEHRGVPLYFLIGADNASTIGRWSRAEEIFTLCRPVIIGRPGIEARFEERDLPFLAAEARESLNQLALQEISVEASSRVIRRRISEEASTEDWLPPEVAEYIQARGLYREESA